MNPHLKPKAEPFSLPWREHDASGGTVEIAYAGFGNIRHRHAAEAVSHVKMVELRHWQWPCDEATRQEATVLGPLTRDAKWRVEAAARYWLSRNAPPGTTDVYWRVKPEWNSSRDFEHDRDEHWLYMRGAFHDETVFR